MLLGSLLLLAHLATPAEADGMRPLNGVHSPFMFQSPMIGHDHLFIPRHVVRRQALMPQFTTMNPGPVPPLTGTIVPPFSVGGMVGTFRNQRNRFLHFHRGFPGEPLFFLGERELQDQAEMPGDTGEESGGAVVEATPPNIPDQSVAGPVAPTRRSGQSVLTGTLDEPQIIFVSPARESTDVRIFAPSGEQHGAANAPAPQIVEVPAH